eukprot:10379856-Karenia_brevis.AAC.1
MRAPLPGYAKPSMDQVRAADFEVFARATELLKEDLSIRAVAGMSTGVLPIDSVLPAILLEPRIQAIMVPLPAAASSKRESSGEITQLREQVKRLKANKG